MTFYNHNNSPHSNLNNHLNVKIEESVVSHDPSNEGIQYNSLENTTTSTSCAGNESNGNHSSIMSTSESINRHFPQCTSGRNGNDHKSIITKLDLGEKEEDDGDGDHGNCNYDNHTDDTNINKNDMNATPTTIHNDPTKINKVNDNTETCNNETNIKINNYRLQSLMQITQYLQDFQVNDDLDEDEIVSKMMKMNAASKKRRRYRRWLMRDYDKGDTISYDDLDPEAYWNDNDIIVTESEKQQQDFNKMAIDAMINIVDDKFFSGIIDGTEEESAQLLDDDTVMSLRQCLAIQDKGKIRKRRDIFVTVNEDNYLSESSDLLEKDGENGSGNRRRTRRMLQESRAKRTDDRDGGEMKGIDALIAAMTDIEESEGRSTSIEFDDIIHQGRRLRDRNKGRETPKKQVIASPMSTDVDSSQKVSKKKRKASASRDISVVSPSSARSYQQDIEMSEDDDDLYALLPAIQSKSKRRSARRNKDPIVVKISSIIVDGRPFLQDEEREEESEEVRAGRKRAYKKRQPYVKRGPYKKRKKDTELTPVKEVCIWFDYLLDYHFISFFSNIFKYPIDRS
jgi:hypothetical protein